MIHTFTVNSAEETQNLARKLGEILQPRTIITLEGDLAAGKTTFTKGLALGLDIKDIIDSPTFSIIKIYDQGRIPLYHMDVYRLDSDSDIDFVLEYLDQEGISVIEWASIIQADLPENRIEIAIKRLEEETREITINDKGGLLEHVDFSY